jgi:polysaccharide export outer membrane protein
VRRIVATAVAGVVLGGCAAGRFRYDKLEPGKDNVEVRDLEALINDADERGGVRKGDIAVEQVQYDFRAERDEYRLGKNDVLNIFVMDHPEMSSQRVNLGEISGTTIRKDGRVYLPVIGSIAAEGLTLTEFENALRQAAARYVNAPQVNIEIMRYESQKFFVLGEVRTPGVFAVDGDTTLLEAISLAGGVPESGSLRAATVIRAGKLLPIDLADVVQHGDVGRNIHMRAGDVVFVPDRSDEKVFVLGEVTQPNVVPIGRNGITLAEALAAAGGPTPARARRELAVIRGGYARPIVYRIDLDKALLVDHQIALRHGDRVVVAPTGLSTASRYMQQILPFLQGLQAVGITAQGAGSIATQAAVLSQ